VEHEGRMKKCKSTAPGTRKLRCRLLEGHKGLCRSGLSRWNPRHPDWGVRRAWTADQLQTLAT